MSKFKKIIFGTLIIIACIISMLFFARIIQINDKKILDEKSKIIVDTDYAIIKKAKENNKNLNCIYKIKYLDNKLEVNKIINANNIVNIKTTYIYGKKIKENTQIVFNNILSAEKEYKNTPKMYYKINKNILFIKERETDYTSIDRIIEDIKKECNNKNYYYEIEG